MPAFFRMFTNLPFAGWIETLAKPQYIGSSLFSMNLSTASTAFALALMNISAGSMPSALNFSRSLFSSIVFIFNSFVIIQYSMDGNTVNLQKTLYLVSFLPSGTISCGFLWCSVIIYVEFTEFHPDLLGWSTILVDPRPQYFESCVVVRWSVHRGTLRSQW